uniref:Photosystem I reaction center subunit PsaK n=1 Tax=Rhodymenia pseudopalmata TaxID=31502 RepID=A0A1C9C7K7_RHOPU|nr:photosystem I subunit X [Rhodymenia pseudopalmata]AOM64359.1 photosystem I subunit X [Rhodymenia pseudopalmata]
MHTIKLLATIPHTSSWSPQIALIMIACNLICIGIGRYAIQVRGLGPSIPILGQASFGLPELLATTSFGHAIGAASIIGLSTIGAIN